MMRTRAKVQIVASDRARRKNAPGHILILRKGLTKPAERITIRNSNMVMKTT